MKKNKLSLRAGLWAGIAVLGVLLPLISQAASYDLVIAEKWVNISGSPAKAIAINNAIPGPELRFREGEQVTINVTNKLEETTSLHWHGLILPYQMDGVPGLSFDGIAPGTTFTYQFTVQQNGTYWYHSHSGLQEQSGVYGPIVIEPKGKGAFRFDRDYTLVLSDWTDDDPNDVLRNLKRDGDYYKTGRKDMRTLSSLASELIDAPTWSTRWQILSERRAWAKMRMDPTDISDVNGYTFLINGRSPEQNWGALYRSGERVRLRLINAAASTYFDFRIPGLKMTVIQKDGQNVMPVVVDQINLAVAETYDVIVMPDNESAYTFFAQSADRTGYARGTLSVRKGMSAEVPEMDPPRILGMMDHSGMDMSGMGQSEMDHSEMDMSSDMANMNHDGMEHDGMAMPEMSHQSMDHGSMMSEVRKPEGLKVLEYSDLRSLEPTGSDKPVRELTIELTGDMENYIWSFNGKKYAMADPIEFDLGERVRVKLINKTMMDHPIHLHGMWQELQNGYEKEGFAPKVHTVNIPPMGEQIVEIDADAVGRWAFHCHILYHADTGMFREVRVNPVNGI